MQPNAGLSGLGVPATAGDRRFIGKPSGDHHRQADAFGRILRPLGNREAAIKRDIQLRMLCGATSILLLSACGGGGGGGSGLVLPPPPPPPPPPVSAPAPVKIFASPTPETYASVGASISGPGGNLDGYDTPDVSFTSVSTGAGDQPEIRYSAAGHYEVRMPGQDWDRLVHYRGLLNPTEDNNYFQSERVQQNYGYVVTRHGLSPTGGKQWRSRLA